MDNSSSVIEEVINTTSEEVLIEPVVNEEIFYDAIQAKKNELYKRASTQISNMNATFDLLVQVINSLVDNLNELQNNFYSPTGKDTTLIYDECAKSIGTNKYEGLHYSIYHAYLWVSAVDQYIQDQEKKASNDNNDN